MIRSVALGSALLGAMAWVANLFVGLAGLSSAGLVLLGSACVLAGAGLVRQVWLALITGPGACALAWSLLELTRHWVDASTGLDADHRVLEGVVGALVGLVVAIGVTREPRAVPQRRGNHRG